MNSHSFLIFLQGDDVREMGPHWIAKEMPWAVIRHDALSSTDRLPGLAPDLRIL
jgi:hypothetical protein